LAHNFGHCTLQAQLHERQLAVASDLALLAEEESRRANASTLRWQVRV